MSSNSNKWLDVRFDFERKELMIRFLTEKQARAYQMKNPEGRILADGNQRDVWLPVSPTMRHIRACADELAICFTSTDAAKKWSDRSLLGRQRQDKSEVFIEREWAEDKLDKLLRPDLSTMAGSYLDPEPARGGRDRRAYDRSASPPGAMASRKKSLSPPRRR